MHGEHEQAADSVLTLTGCPVLASVHLSPAGDTSGFHLPAAVVVVAGEPLPLPLPLLDVAVAAAAVGVAAVGVLAAVAGVGAGVVIVVVVVVAGARVALGVGVGPPLSRDRPLRAALAEPASKLRAQIAMHICTNQRQGWAVRGVGDRRC